MVRKDKRTILLENDDNKICRTAADDDLVVVGIQKVARIVLVCRAVKNKFVLYARRVQRATG